ncbi:MAG TPA: hypothetical protein VNS09_13120, partial [Solirubrobacter sp.]|nr:hypothetical protein [Solirubrobacter sp.]
FGVREFADISEKCPDAPIACGWVARHVGLPKKTVHRALRSLVDAGVIQWAGQMPGRGGKRGTFLYLPGDAEPVTFEDVAERAKPRADGPSPVAGNEAVDPNALVDRAVARAREGNRNDTGLWLACQLRDNRTGLVEAIGLMRQYVDRTPRSASRRDDYTWVEARRTLEGVYARPERTRDPWGHR